MAQTFEQVLFHCFKDPRSHQDYKAQLIDILKKLFELCAKPGKEAQIGATMSILRVLQLPNIGGFDEVFEYAFGCIQTILSLGGFKVPASILECLLFLNKTFSRQCASTLQAQVELIRPYIRDKGSKTKKISLDNLYLLMILHTDAIKPLVAEVHAEVVECKNDIDKGVRESAMNCIETMKSMALQDFKGGRKSSGAQPKRVLVLPERKKLSDKRKEQAREEPLPEAEERPRRQTAAEERPQPQRKSVERKPLKSQTMNPNFKKSVKEGVEIFVGYPLNSRNEFEPETGGLEEERGGEESSGRLASQRSGRFGAEGEEENVEYEDEYVEVDVDREDNYDSGEVKPSHSQDQGSPRASDQGTSRTLTQRPDLVYHPRQRDPARRLPAGAHAPPETSLSESGRRHSKRPTATLETEPDDREVVIDHQNQKIKRLSKQVSHLSENLNLVLDKAASLEQDLRQLSMKQPLAQPFQYMLPSYVPFVYPQPAPAFAPAIDPGLAELRRRDLRRQEEEADWRARRREDEERLEAKLRRVERERLGRGPAPDRPKSPGQASRAPRSFAGSMVERPTAQLPAEDQAARLRQRAARTLNLTLAKLVEENEYRKLLDFLAEKENLGSFGVLEPENVRRLVPKLTDMLSLKVELYIEAALPWLAKALAAPDCVSPAEAEDLAYVVGSILQADKKRKAYQHLTVEALNRLQQALQAHAEGFE